MREKEIPQKKLVLYGRISVFILIILAVILTIFAQKIVFWFVLFSWSGLGVSLGPALIFSLYDRKINSGAILAGMVTGALVTVIWTQIPLLKSSLYELVPAFILSFTAILFFRRSS